MEQEKDIEYNSNNPTTIRLSRLMSELLKKSNILFYEKSFSSLVNKSMGLYIYQFLQNIEKKDEKLIKFCEYCNNKYNREPIIELRKEEKRKLFLRKRIIKDIGLYSDNQFSKKSFIDLLTLYAEESKFYVDNEEITKNINEVLQNVKDGKKSNLKELGDKLFKELVSLK